VPRDDDTRQSIAASSGPLTGLKLAIILKGYPRLSETFIAQEIEGLERAGADILLISLRHPTDAYRHPVHNRIRAQILYLPEYLYQEPWRVLKAVSAVLRCPQRSAVLRQWWCDFRRDPTANRIRRLGQAMVLAAEIQRYSTVPFDLLYAHFIHTPCSVARYAATLLGLPFAISAHAKDIYTSDPRELAGKLNDALWTVTCTAGNQDYLRALASRPDAVHLVYHGLDQTDLQTTDAMGPMGPDSAPADKPPIRLLTVGRAVKKKGLDTILDALAALPDDLHWHWEHVGGGELLPQLKQKAAQSGIGDRITWHGAQPRRVVRDCYRRADLFLMASRITHNGDRDGLPNVLMEAASFAVPAIGTRVGALPEFIENDVSGLLVDPDDPAAFARAIEQLAGDRTRLQRYGQAAALRLETAFGFDHCLDPLLKLLHSLKDKSADPGITCNVDQSFR
jgi:glycosyltransferase involved in cell wall biosynthesis